MGCEGPCKPRRGASPPSRLLLQEVGVRTQNPIRPWEPGELVKLHGVAKENLSEGWISSWNSSLTVRPIFHPLGHLHSFPPDQLPRISLQVAERMQVRTAELPSSPTTFLYVYGCSFLSQNGTQGSPGGSVD